MSLIILNVDEVRRTLSASDGAFVVHDKEVDIVRFAINSGFADIVLDGQVALRVMYQRPGETEVRAQTLTYYDTDGLHNYYDWQLSQSDLAKNGSLMVALCILDISGGEVSEWHTTPCAVRVLSTIHTDDSDEGDDTITPTVKERVAVLESMIQRVASGAPIVVASTSAMTDTEQIYVLSTDGNWYYHNGTAWVAGGEYGGVAAGSITTDKLANKSVTTAKIADGAVTAGKLASGAVPTDTTLTQAGIPADAKAVGNLKSAMDINIEFNAETDLEPGAFTVYGGNSAQNQTYKEYRSKYIDLHNAYSVSIGIQFEQAYDIAGYCCAYDANRTAICISDTVCRKQIFGTGAKQATGAGTFVLPPNTVYVRFFVRTFDAGYTLSITGIIKPEKFIDDLQAMSDAVDTKIAVTNSNVIDLNDYIDYISPSLELIDYDDLTPGYINGQGGIYNPSTGSKEKTSQVININPAHTYTFVCDVPIATGESWLAVGLWGANDKWLGRQSAIVTTVGDVSHAEYTLTPKNIIQYTNATYMRVSWRTYGAYMAEVNDITFQDKVLIDIINDEQSGANKTYRVNGGMLDVGKHGFDIVQLGFSPHEESGKYAQGMAISNDVIFQGYGNGSIDLLDLQTGELINSYTINGGHCGSLSFSNVYPEGNTEFPLLYVASYNENKTFVYSITRSECTLVNTYLIPESVAGYCQETCIDKVNGILWCVGHKANSYSAGEGLIVSAWDLANATESDGLYTPAEIMHYEAPWVPYLQAVQVLNGQLFMVFGRDGSASDMLTHILVTDLGKNTPKSDIIDFPDTVLNSEPEGLDFVYNANTYKYDAILATRQYARYYRLEF